MQKISRAFILIGLAVLLSACSISLAENITPPPGSEQRPPQQATEVVPSIAVYPIVPPNLENGAKLYNLECVLCHGPKGLGDGSQAAKLSIPVAPLGLADISRLRTPAEWYRVVTQGNMERFMPPFSSLTDRQRWDVVAYAMTLGVSSETIEQGKAIYQENCSNCHGLAGKGDGPQAVKLTARLIDFTDQSILAQKSSSSLYQVISSGAAPDMPAYGNLLDESELWAVVNYLRSFTFTPAIETGEAYPAPSIPASAAYPEPQAYPQPVEIQNPDLTPTKEITATTPFTGTVSVQLINGSGIDAPSDVPVILYGFDDMQNTYSETLTISVNGVYTFTNVYMPEGRVFLAGAEYASGTYGSGMASVDPANPDIKLQMTVYDSSTDVSALSTDRAHLIFDFSDPQTVQVMEVFIISNPTNLAVVSPSEDGIVVTFPLPEGYTNLQFQDGDLGGRYLQVAQGFADTMPIKPGMGEYQVIFAFQMPYDRKLDFVQTLYLPASAVVVMLPDKGVNIESQQLLDAGTREINGTTYHMYNASGLLAGSSLEFILSGKPAQASTPAISSANMQNLAIGLGVFGVALILAGLWLFRQNRLKSASQLFYAGEDLPATGLQPDALLEDEDTLMDAIIALDDQYRAGNLPEEAYLERRAVLKEKLKNIGQG